MKLKSPLIPPLLLNLQPVNGLQPRNDAPITDTAPAAILQQNPGCALVSSTLFACESSSPGFTSLLPSAQAPCLCYSSSTWVPNIFDKAVQTCANFASTAVPGAYPAFVNLEGFCGNVGNVRTMTKSASRSDSKITTSISTSLIPNASTSADPACYTALSLIQLCVGLVPGFMALDPTKQASCLCYTSITSWVPKSFDGAVENCSLYAHSGSQSESVIKGLVSSVDIFEGLCESVGDVLTTANTQETSSVSGGEGANTITSTDLSEVPATTMMTPKPAGVTSTTIAVTWSTATQTYSQNTHSVVKTIPVITMSKSITSTTSTTGFNRPNTGNEGGDGGANSELREVSDPVVILISFVCAALVLFLC